MVLKNTKVLQFQRLKMKQVVSLLSGYSIVYHFLCYVLDMECPSLQRLMSLNAWSSPGGTVPGDYRTFGV